MVKRRSAEARAGSPQEMSSKPENRENFWTLPSVHIPLPIEEIGAYPLLAQCLTAWRQTATQGLPPTIDPLDMPPAAIKAISLAEWSGEHADWVLRLSSTLIDESHGRSMRGTTFAEAFEPTELARVHARVREILDRGEPDLAKHEFHDPNGRIWSFVRLILPLSSDGVKRDRYCLVFDPLTFGKRISS